MHSQVQAQEIPEFGLGNAYVSGLCIIFLITQADKLCLAALCPSHGWLAMPYHFTEANGPAHSTLILTSASGSVVQCLVVGILAAIRGAQNSEVTEYMNYHMD